MPALPVTPGGGEPGVLQYLVDDLVGDVLAGVVAGRERGAHDIVEFHLAQGPRALDAK